ncbi:glycosyltransferase family 39 protein [Candidatus Woesearchaeota archaeon]|nr:glycosyltransferase family 39 protein [Candidatus Woesearchaeota archaeon]
MEKSMLDKTLDFILGKNYAKHLLWIFIIAFILRIITAVNLGPNADEMLHATHSIDIIKSGLIEVMDQDPVWFYITDVFFRFLGVSMLSSRIFAVISGSLSAIMIYLITAEIFKNKKIALVSGILVSFSSFSILTSIAEMDIPMIFFVLLSFYFLVKGMNNHNYKLFYLSYFFLGIAVMIKQIAIAFIPAYLIALAWHFIRRNKLSGKAIKEILKNFIVFGIILIIIVSPVLAFNYLLYKDQKIVDVQFSRFLGIGKDTYAPISATMKQFSITDLFFTYENGKHPPGLVESARFFMDFDIIITMLFIIGLFILYRKDKFWSVILFLLFLFPYLFLSGTSLLPYHFSYAITVFSIFAASVLVLISEKIKIKHALTVLLIVIIIFNMYTINKNNAFSGKSEVAKMMDYAKNIEDDSLVLVDSRIYRGRIAWMFNDKHYLEITYLNQANEMLKKSYNNPAQIKTYLIECTSDDCGWGNINSQPQLNQSMEDFFSSFKTRSELKEEITASDNSPYFAVYETTLSINPLILDIADSTHVWFYYPVRYKIENQIFGRYNVHNSLDSAIDMTAHIILYIEVIIALLALVLPFYLLKKEYENEENENTKHHNTGL